MPLLGCRYQVWDTYSHSQVDLTALTVVPHITYTLQQPTNQPSDVSCALLQAVVGQYLAFCWCPDVVSSLSMLQLGLGFQSTLASWACSCPES